MANEDIILKKLDEHDRRFDKIDSDITTFKQQISTAQDEMLSILRRLDEERIFTTAWVQRIEKEVETHTKEIATIKAALKVK